MLLSSAACATAPSKPLGVLLDAATRRGHGGRYGLAERLLGPIPIALDYTPTWQLYRAEPRMYKGFREVAEEIQVEEAVAGDILLFGAGKGSTHHCAFVTPESGLIHFYRKVGRVVEHGFSPEWRPRLRHAFQFPQNDPLSLPKKVLDGVGRR